jgi:hypothetical protein
MLKILLNAGNSPNLGFAYDIFFMFTTIIYVKIAMTWRQSAGVRSLHTSEASQRLHAGDLLLNKNFKIINSSYSFSTLRSGILFNSQSHVKYARGFSTSTLLSPNYVSGFSLFFLTLFLSEITKKKN